MMLRKNLLFVLLSLSLFATSSIKQTQSTHLISLKNQPVVVKRLSVKAIKKLQINLQTNFKSALKRGGFKEALNFCANNAQKITKKVQDNLPKGVKIKRVSKKFRNPKNAPDYIDTLAYSYFEQMFKRDKKYPEYWLAKLRNKKDHSDIVYRYYKPIIVKKKCLSCHGTNIKPSLLKTIRNKYPQDKAVQFHINDLRGFFAVEVTKEALIEK